MEAFGLGVEVEQTRDESAFGGDTLGMWAGPVGNWIAACDHIFGLDCETIVPGHGSVTNRRSVEAVRDYLTYIRDETRKRYDAGLTARDAERIAVNVATLYPEFTADVTLPNPTRLFALMGETWKKECGQTRPHHLSGSRTA